MTRRTKKQPSGAAKLKAAGKHAIMLGVRPEVLEQLRTAAAIEMRPLSQFIVYYALQAAQTVIARAPEPVSYARYGTAAQIDPRPQQATPSHKRRK